MRIRGLVLPNLCTHLVIPLNASRHNGSTALRCGVVGTADHHHRVGGAPIPGPGVAVGGGGRPAGTRLGYPRPVAADVAGAIEGKRVEGTERGFGLSEQTIANVCILPSYGSGVPRAESVEAGSRPEAASKVLNGLGSGRRRWLSPVLQMSCSTRANSGQPLAPQRPVQG